MDSEIGPFMTKPYPENGKNGSLKCAYDDTQLSTQYNSKPLLPPDKHHNSDVIYQRRGYFRMYND